MIPVAAYWVNNEINYVFVDPKHSSVKKTFQLKESEKIAISTSGICPTFASPTILNFLKQNAKEEEEDPIEEPFGEPEGKPTGEPEGKPTEEPEGKPTGEPEIILLDPIEDSQDEGEIDLFPEPKRKRKLTRIMSDSEDSESEDERNLALFRRKQEEEDEKKQFKSLAFILKSKSSVRTDSVFHQIFFNNPVYKDYKKDPKRYMKSFLDHTKDSPGYKLLRSFLDGIYSTCWKTNVFKEIYRAVLTASNASGSHCEACFSEKPKNFFIMEVLIEGKWSTLRVGCICVKNMLFYGNLNKFVEIVVCYATSHCKEQKVYDVFEKASKILETAYDEYNQDKDIDDYFINNNAFSVVPFENSVNK